MPAPYGLTSTGFSRKTLEEVLDEVQVEEKARIDSRLNTETEEPIGQLNGIFASKLSEVWELAEAVNAGRFPDSGSGFQLDQVSSITGTLRGPATKGTVVLTVTATAPATIPAGSIVQVLGDDGNRWVTLEEVVFLVPGSTTVNAEAELAGIFVANSTTITVIVTPVAGWDSVTNLAPAVPGTDIDTDAQLRIRRANELSRAGSTTLDAIRSDVLDVEDVTSATIFHNPTNFVDAAGLPPGTVEALVIGGTDQDVRDGLLATVAAGVDTFGTIVGTATDSQGQVHTVRFSRPTEIDILVEVDLEIDTQAYPSGGNVLVQDSVAAYTNSTPVGFDEFISQVSAAALRDTTGALIAGIINVSAVRIGSVLPVVAPVAVDYTIAARQLATMSASANVTVVTTPGSP